MIEEKSGCPASVCAYLVMTIILFPLVPFVFALAPPILTLVSVSCAAFDPGETSRFEPYMLLTIWNIVMS